MSGEVVVEGLVTKVGRIKCYNPGDFYSPPYIAFYLQVDSEEHGLVNAMVEVTRDEEFPKRPFSGDTVRITAQKIKEDNWMSVTLNRKCEVLDNHGQLEYLENNKPVFSDEIKAYLKAKQNDKLEEDRCIRNFEQMLLAYLKKDEVEEGGTQYLIQFGKHYGKHITDIPVGYVKWMLGEVEKEMAQKVTPKQTELEKANEAERKAEEYGEGLVKRLNDFYEEGGN